MAEHTKIVELVRGSSELPSSSADELLSARNKKAKAAHGSIVSVARIAEIGQQHGGYQGDWEQAHGKKRGRLLIGR